jgi:glycerol uptake facilitator protein
LPCVLLQNSKGQNSGWIVITAGWAFAVLFGVFIATATGSPDAHINPAVTLGFAVVSGNYSKIATYVPAQLLGGVLVWLRYPPHWEKTESAGFKLAVFCTAPAIRNTMANLISEITGTVTLVFVVAAIFSKQIMATGIPPTVGPYMVAMLVWGIGLVGPLIGALIAGFLIRALI